MVAYPLGITFDYLYRSTCRYLCSVIRHIFIPRFCPKVNSLNKC
nr:MAG TPA: hypothetical protein [Caudoviricetes sp.]DAY52305.1 MAG TPA: hypothetical protein [Caudoviricetes sp.]